MLQTQFVAGPGGYQTAAHFKTELAEAKKEINNDPSVVFDTKRKTIVTQLTCSANIDAYFQVKSNPSGLCCLTSLYNDRADKPMGLSAGPDTIGDEVGVRRSQTGIFSIKRKATDQAPDADADPAADLEVKRAADFVPWWDSAPIMGKD